MKKRALAIFAVLAVLCLSLFSCKNEYEQIINVEEIKILDENIKTDSTSGDYVVIHRNNETGRLEYKIEYSLSPSDATDKTVRFTYDKADAEAKGITVSEDGLVSFTSGGQGMAIKVVLVPADGSNVQAQITILALE